jgi:hypothetical protein
MRIRTALPLLGILALAGCHYETAPQKAESGRAGTDATSTASTLPNTEKTPTTNPATTPSTATNNPHAADTTGSTAPAKPDGAKP